MNIMVVMLSNRKEPWVNIIYIVHQEIQALQWKNYISEYTQYFIENDYKFLPIIFSSQGRSHSK